MSAITIQRTGGRYVLGQAAWPEVGEFAKELLLDRPERVRWSDDRIDIRLDNARAVYRVDPYASDDRTLMAKLVYSEGPWPQG